MPDNFVPDDHDAPVFGRNQHGHYAMATYAAAGERGLVRYLPSIVRDPAVLIGTFAHELGHHLIGVGSATPPQRSDRVGAIRRKEPRFNAP